MSGTSLIPTEKNNGTLTSCGLSHPNVNPQTVASNYTHTESLFFLITLHPLQYNPRQWW